MAKSCMTPLIFEIFISTKTGIDCCNIRCESSNTVKARARHQSWWGMFWTDSTVVLSYIENTKRCFKMFVANRIHQINKSNSDVSQWHYIQVTENPADDCSKGLGMKRHSRVQRWFRGPEFQWKPMSTWQNEVDYYKFDEDDKEVKIIKINSVQIQSDVLATFRFKNIFLKENEEKNCLCNAVHL